MKFSEELLCLFTAEVERRDGSYVVEIPQHEVAVGDVEEGTAYRVAMLSRTDRTGAKPEPRSAPEGGSGAPEPPVERGDVLDVEIEDLGEQGDGIARVGPGYVVIVPGTEVGERVSVEITEARENLAFAEVVDRYDR